MTNLIRRTYRFDVRLLLGLARLVGRRLFDFWVVEEDGKMVATTLIVYLKRTGHLGTVAVLPGYRRRGFAQAILARCHEEIRRSGRRYATLEVLSDNSPAQALYARIGYRRLSGGTFMSRDPAPGERLPVGSAAPIRAFEKRDATALVDVANAAMPPAEREIFPMTVNSFTVPPLIATAVHSVSEAWVIEDGAGPVAFLRATVGGLTRSAHLTQPVLGAHVSAEAALDLTRTALNWIGSQRTVRSVVQVNEGMTLARQTLATVGFVPQASLDTMVLGLAA